MDMPMFLAAWFCPIDRCCSPAAAATTVTAAATRSTTAPGAIDSASGPDATPTDPLDGIGSVEEVVTLTGIQTPFTEGPPPDSLTEFRADTPPASCAPTTSPGTVTVPKRPANCTFGDADKRTLYITAQNTLYKVSVVVPGL